MAPDGTVSYMNATLSAYLGGLGALDEDGFRHVHPDDRPISREACSQGLEQEQPFTFEARLARTDGEWRHHRFTLVPRNPAASSSIGSVPPSTSTICIAHRSSSVTRKSICDWR